VANPRTLDLNLVDAQQARRVLDRLVGFELSPVLWRKVKSGLSAGRVQSVAVRLVAEREREIAAFNAEGYYKVVGQFLSKEQKPFKAELTKKIALEADANAYLQRCNGATFSVADLQTKPGKRNPAPPFITSTLQQEASLKLGFPVQMTMRLAQGLYEAGHITYMRTDSVSLSGQAMAAMAEVIISDYGERYHQSRQFKSKNASAQEAHEAIRPTNLRARSAGADDAERKLYDLIWKRAVASQMASAELERTVVQIAVAPATPGPDVQPLTATGEVITFDGFLRLYLESKNDDTEDEDTQGLLPALAVGDTVALLKMTATERFSRPPARYNEASLVKKLEELGIGRPSTYAPTISTIQKREYVVRESREGTERNYRLLTLKAGKITDQTKKEITGAEKQKLFPTDLGLLVTDFLLQHFTQIMDYSFTAKVEEEFDHIAEGNMEWHQMIHHFYGPFKELVTHTAREAERVAGERVLGTDPQTGKPVIARLGRFGPLVQIGTSDDPEKRFASLLKGQRLETITLPQALKLFELPRLLGDYDGKKVEANVGRFGPYIKHDGTFTSIPKGTDLYAITLEDAIALIEAKREADRNRLIKEFPGTEFKVLRGKWGPFVSHGKTNLKLSKEQKENPEALTLADCQQLLEAQGETTKPARKGAAKDKATAPAAPTKRAAPRKAAPKVAAEAKPKAPRKTTAKTTAKAKTATKTKKA
jgi:DNA topoisomerase-1